MSLSEADPQPSGSNGQTGSVVAAGTQPHLSNTLSTPRPVFMPETFTGVGRQWTDWSEQFDLAADVNNWDDSLKLKFMSLLLSGRARDIYSGIPAEAKSNYLLLKAAMTRCLEPSDSDDWSRAAFAGRRRLHNETAREFGNVLRRLAVRAYPTADEGTRDLLARDHFITHFATGDFRISLRSAKPDTLESAISLAAEMELLRNLEHSQAPPPDVRVREVSEHRTKADERMDDLLGVVEGLRQEIKSLQGTVQAMHRAPTNMFASGGQPRDPGEPAPPTRPGWSRERTVLCWECRSDRHIRRDCPYLQGN